MAASAPARTCIKALALGAKGVFIGRAFLYGLGAMGEQGVTLALDIIRRELDTTMALCGLRDIRTWTGASWPWATCRAGWTTRARPARPRPPGRQLARRRLASARSARAACATTPA